MRRHAVIGLGNFGMALALELTALGEHVVAVDADPDRAREAQAHVHQALVADATNGQSLRAMDLAAVDVVCVSLGGRIDASVLAVYHLTQLGVGEIVAKALDEDHAEILRRVGATRVVYPERDMAARVAESLSSDNVLDYLSLAPGFNVAELAPPAAFIGKTLAQLDLARRLGVQVLAIKELVPERTTIAPGPEHVVKDSDLLVVIGGEGALEKLKES